METESNDAKAVKTPMLISIIIPYYNREKLIAETLKSVFAQTYRPLQVVLVDNNSTDASAKICAKFAEKHSGIDFQMVLAEEAKKGASAARNKGVALAKGEWVYFFDSDDEMSPTYISDLSLATIGDEADMVCNRTAIVMPSGAIKTRYSRYSSSVGLQIVSAMLSTQSMAFSKEWLIKAGGWDEKLPCWNDWELGTRSLLLKPRVKWLKGKVYHRILRHQASISGNAYSPIWQNILASIRKVECDIAALGTGKEAWPLALKATFTAGRLAFEGNKQGAGSLLNEAFSIADSLGDRRFKKIMLKSLYSYTKHGGRGAWAVSILLI